MGYIFEAEIEAIFNAVRARTIGEAESIKLRDLLASDIHPAIKAYFKAEVEKTLQQERGKEIRSKRFSYSHPEIVSLQQQIDLLLMQHYQFNQHEFESLLDESVHFQFNYLCRPQWTLLSFIFGNQRRISCTEIEKKLKYCVDYTYFADLIKRYIVEKGLAEITYEEFKSLTEKIDREVVAQHSSVELARMPRALFAFVDAAKIVPHDRFDQPTLPINAAVVFFEDKQLNDIKTRLEFERDKNNIKQLTVAELATVIEKIRPGNEDASVSATPPPPGSETAGPTNGEEERPLTAAQQETLSNEEASPQNSADADGFREVRVQHEKTPSHPGEKGRVELQDVYSLFSPSDQERFVKSIFHRDQESFHSALHELNALGTWQEASHYLDALFVAQNVDPFSREAVQFTDRVYARYFPSTET